MDNPGLMSQGLTLLMLGMGTVFVFLALLVVVTTSMSSLVQKFLLQTDTAAAALASTPEPASSSQRPELIAAITAAIHQHRRDSRNDP